MITLLLFLFIAGGQKKPTSTLHVHTAMCVAGSHQDANEECVWDNGQKKPTPKPLQHGSTCSPENPCEIHPPPVTQYSDGCNTTTCRGDMCVQTLRACVKADEPELDATFPIRVHSIPAEPLGSTSGDKRYEYLNDEMLGSPDGSRVVKLSDAEYTHLQELRKAVVDEEKRIAVKYGADPWSAMDCLNMQRGATKEGMKELNIYPGLTNKCDPEAYPDRKDHYEYHKQFLIIEKEK